MRRSIVARSVAAIIAVVLAASPAAAQTPAPQQPAPPQPAPPQPVQPAPPQPVPPLPVPPAAPLTLPVTGTTSEGQLFTGHLSLHRFVARDNQLMAVVTVTGAVSSATGFSAGSFLKGLVETPVQVSTDTPPAPAPPGAPARQGNGPAPRVPKGATVVAPQQALQEPPCPLIKVEISGLTVDVLGLVITITTPLVLYIGGDTASGQLGSVVCQTVDALNNVTSLAGLLNVLLMLLASPTPAV